MVNAVTKVECANCGGNSLGLWIAIAALVFTAIGLLFAGHQYREFLKQLRARARFAIDLEVVGYPDGVVKSDASNAFLRLKIGIKNTGTKAAAATLLNVVYPRLLDSARWSGPNGEEIGPIAPTNDTDELLRLPNGGELPARYIARERARVGVKPHLVVYVNFHVTIPLPGEDTLVLPMRVKAQADELPDDVNEEIEQLVVRVEPRTASA